MRTSEPAYVHGLWDHDTAEVYCWDLLPDLIYEPEQDDMTPYVGIVFYRRDVDPPEILIDVFDHWREEPNDDIYGHHLEVPSVSAGMRQYLFKVRQIIYGFAN